jgi:hypothetical protein
VCRCAATGGEIDCPFEIVFEVPERNRHVEPAGK